MPADSHRLVMGRRATTGNAEGNGVTLFQFSTEQSEPATAHGETPRRSRGNGVTLFQLFAAPADAAAPARECSPDAS